MKYAFAQVAFGLGANALVARDSSQQCIQLKSSGGASGTLGQLSDGQNRVGGSNPSGCYCLSNGGFTDSNGRGCILTPPTTQFQCDSGAAPTSGFTIGSNGQVSYNGNGKFYACPATENGEYNVYSQPVSGQNKCVEISLSSGGSCSSGAQPSKPAQSQPAQSSKPAQSQPGYPASQPAPQSSKPTPQPSKPAQQSSKPAPQPSPSAYQPSKPAPQPSKPAQSQPAQPSKPAQSQPGYPASQPSPQSSQPAYQPSKPAPQPSKPAQSQPAQPSKPAQSQPGYPASKPAPQPSPSAYQPSQPAPQPSKPAPQPSQPAAQPSQPSQPNQPSNSCPADLNGNYQYPHLIVPVDSQQPSTASGTSYNGKVNSHTCSIFNFDIPASYSGKTCTLTFLFPSQKDLQTSSYTVSGSGQCMFSKLKGPASQQTTWANQPGKESELGSWNVAPGNSYTISSGACAAGQTVSYEICSGGDFSLEYFQDYNPSPIGLYIREC